jgi:hypothetical protein
MGKLSSPLTCQTITPRAFIRKKHRMCFKSDFTAYVAFNIHGPVIFVISLNVPTIVVVRNSLPSIRTGMPIADEIITIMRINADDVRQCQYCNKGYT